MTLAGEVRSPTLVTRQELRGAVLRTIAYSDVFEYPLSVAEAHRYLIGTEASIDEVAAALSAAHDQGELIQQGGLYALAGRVELFGLRRRRNEQAAKLWPTALRYGRLIGRLPFVRMVAATGALAANNVEPNADLDYLIVTGHGFLWVTRAMILALDRVSRLLGAPRLCPNFLLTETRLALEERDLFAAEELARMAHIYGTEVYARMLSENRWSRLHLPNAEFATALGGSKTSWFKRIVEQVLANAMVRWLENWEMKRKVAKLSSQDTSGEARFSADQCKGHFDGHKNRAMLAYAERLRRLGLGEA